MSLFAGNLTTFWAGDGGYKLPREDVLPEGSCSTCTLTRTWDGTTATTFAAKNEVVSLCFYLGAGASTATSVNVLMSSFTGPSGNSIVAVSTTGVNTWNLVGRPYQVFIASYVPNIGITRLSWDASGGGYEERDFPTRMRRPYTVNGNNQGVASGTWSDRPDHDKSYPDVLIPNELFASSSFTVNGSHSQMVWVDVYISTSLATGDYTGLFSVYEGVTVSTQIPVTIHVYNFTLPDAPSFPVVAYLTGYNINYRHQGIHWDRTSAANITTRKRYYQMLHAHKLAGMATEDQVNDCGYSNKWFPCPENITRLDGSLYTSANGYANAPGVNTGDQYYSIGPYANWSWSKTDSDAFCTAVSSWGAYFYNNFPTVKSYVQLADETLTNVDKWSTWMSTIPSCQTSGYKVNSMVTSNWTSVNTSAPNVDMPFSTGWIGTSSATWQIVADSYTAVGNAWAYNGHPSWNGTLFAIEDSGSSAREILWANKKMGVNGHFLWEAAYFTDSNNAGNDNDVFDVAKTFGYDTGSDSVLGRAGYAYSQGDGVLVYPGSDTIHSPSWGVDGPFATIRLKYLRRSIQDMDYYAAAYAIDPSSTSAILSEMVPEALWEHECFDSGDCSYSYGGRTWSDDPDEWEDARYRLALLATSEEEEEPAASSSDNVFMGNFRFQGGGGAFR